MKRHSTVALDPNLCSPLSPFPFLFHSTLFYLLIVPANRIALKNSKLQKLQMQNMSSNISYSLGMSFSVFLFFSGSVTPYPLLSCRLGVCLPPTFVLCQSGRGKLPCMSMCKCVWTDRKTERGKVCVCLCVLHCSEWASRGCFKQAALPMWPAQPQAGIRYWDTDSLSKTLYPSLSLSLLMHTMSTVHPLATAQGSGKSIPHTHTRTHVNQMQTFHPTINTNCFFFLLCVILTFSFLPWWRFTPGSTDLFSGEILLKLTFCFKADTVA